MDLAEQSRHLRLEAEIALERFGFWLPLAGLLLGTGLALWLLVIPSLQAGLTLQQQQLAALHAAKQQGPSPVTAFPDPNAHNLALFEQALPHPKEQPVILQAIFAMARQQGLTLAQANYRNGHHPQNYYDTTQITLPLQGSYRAVRRFSLSVLGTLPFCSIDEMAFKREAIETNQVQAQLHLTLWLKPLSSGNAQTRPFEGAGR